MSAVEQVVVPELCVAFRFAGAKLAGAVVAVLWGLDVLQRYESWCADSKNDQGFYHCHCVDELAPAFFR